MITLKEGKKFKQAFHIYKCEKCGFKGFVAANKDVINTTYGKGYNADVYERKTKHIDGFTSDHTVCPYCDNTIGYTIYTEPRDKEYMKELIGKSVTLANGVKITLKIDDLFY